MSNDQGTSHTDDRDAIDADTRSQMLERLSWAPAERLAYLRQMIAFERRARRARRVG